MFCPYPWVPCMMYPPLSLNSSSNTWPSAHFAQPHWLFLSRLTRFPTQGLCTCRTARPECSFSSPLTSLLRSLLLIETSFITLLKMNSHPPLSSFSNSACQSLIPPDVKYYPSPHQNVHAMEAESVCPVPCRFPRTNLAQNRCSVKTCWYLSTMIRREVQLVREPILG